MTRLLVVTVDVSIRFSHIMCSCHMSRLRVAPPLTYCLFVRVETLNLVYKARFSLDSLLSCLPSPRLNAEV